MTNNLISVVVNCYNGEKYLYKCLKSIKDQTYKNFEVIFFDNCSSDKSKEIFQDFKDERFKYFKNENFSNLSKARNKAIKKANGEIISILDTDDFWEKEMLYNVNNAFNNYNDIKFIYTNFYILKNNKRIKINSKINKPIFKSIFKNYKLGINTLSFKREIFDNYKFDERFHMIGDFDLVIKLLNYKFYHINEYLSYYRNHQNNETNKKKYLHIRELKKWYCNNKFNNKYKMELKKYFLPKIIYLKCLYNLNSSEYTKFFLNFKKLSFRNMYKYKAIYYFFILSLRNKK